LATSTVEQYVKTIYALSLKGDGLVKLGNLAEAMSVTQGTVTSMMKQIEEQGLLKYFPRQGLELTAKGKTLGLRMIRRHRLIETFLVDKLDYDWADVHDEAEALEHAVSSKFIEKLDELLDHPNYDPHGDPIPNALGDWEHRDLISLSQCTQGAQVVIARILDEGHSLLDYLKNSGLVPGAVWVISRVLNGADTLEITSEELHRKEVMAKSTAEKIMVEKL
jgi:DtxR family Mn-dependent transcriptional regulator